MSKVSSSEPKRVGGNGWGVGGRRNDGRWDGVSEEKREQYLKIEARVREKMAKGLL